MQNNKRISLAVIKRLPRYYRYLGELLDNSINRISSKELSEKMNLTASQIRQDLNNFGGFGQQGYGYNVEFLYNEIRKILGIDQKKTMIIIGVGNIGQALANYSNFEKRGFYLIGLFDVNPRIIGISIKGIEIKDVDLMEEFIKNNHVDIGILTLPKNKVTKIAQDLVDLGIKGLWNFSPVDLKVPEDVVVENVHLSDSLMTLAYNLDEVKKKNCKLTSHLVGLFNFREENV